MLHLLPIQSEDARPVAYAEAVSRLASVRHALRLVDPFGGGPASDPSNDDQAVASAWDGAGAARQHLFDRRAERLVGATAAGLEALVAAQGAGRVPNEEAGNALAEEIRRELAEVARVVLS